MAYKTREIPDGKAYGVFNGTLELFNQEEVLKMCGYTEDEIRKISDPKAVFKDWSNYLNGVGVFELPPEWIKNRKAEWRQEEIHRKTAYYF